MNSNFKSIILNIKFMQDNFMIASSKLLLEEVVEFNTIEIKIFLLSKHKKASSKLTSKKLVVYTS